MKKLILLLLPLVISTCIHAQTGGSLTNNNANCNVTNVTLLATAVGLGDNCGDLVTNAVSLVSAGGSIYGWNHLCSSGAFPGWSVATIDPLSGPCPSTADHTFIWTDAIFTFSCPSPCAPVTARISNSSGGCLSYSTFWSSSCGLYTMSASWGTTPAGVAITFN